MADRFALGAADERPALTAAGRTLSYRTLQDRIDAVPLPEHGPLDLSALDLADALAGLFAAARAGVPVRIGPADDNNPVPLPTDAFLIVSTSGSSGRARTVIRTAASWLSSFRPVADRTGLHPADRVLLTGPLTSTLHLFAAVHTLWLGAELTDDPAVATAAHVVPTVLADLLSAPSPQLRTVVVAGAALPGRIEQAALDRGLRLVEYYGAAELSFVAIRVAPQPFRPFPGVQVRVVDGQLWAHSPYLASDSGSDGPTVRRALDGFVSVGDQAELTADGVLVIRGRGLSAITTGGHTVPAHDVEQAIAAVDGVRAVVVLPLPHDRLGQIVAAAIETDAELAPIRRVVRARLPAPAVPRRWLTVARLPRLPSGKLDRCAALELLLAGAR